MKIIELAKLKEKEVESVEDMEDFIIEWCQGILTALIDQDTYIEDDEKDMDILHSHQFMLGLTNVLANNREVPNRFANLILSLVTLWTTGKLKEVEICLSAYEQGLKFIRGENNYE